MTFRTVQIDLVRAHGDIQAHYEPSGAEVSHLLKQVCRAAVVQYRQPLTVMSARDYDPGRGGGK